MLVKFRFCNFRSFDSDQCLSLVSKVAFKERLSWNTMATTRRDIPYVGKVAALFGANASGKSNVIKALQILQWMVCQNSTDVPAEYGLEGFAFDQELKQRPSDFEIVLCLDGVMYRYQLSIHQGRVVKEALHYAKKAVYSRLFERELTDDGEYTYGFGAAFKGPKKQWQEMTRPEALYLSTGSLFNAADLRPVYDWVRSRLVVVNELTPINALFTLQALVDDKLDKMALLALLSSADFGISDILVSRQKVRIRPTSEENEAQGSVVERDVLNAVMMHSVEGKNLPLPIFYESLGTQRFLKIAGPITDIFTRRKGVTLVVDELDASLHTVLVEKIVALFVSKENQENPSQLIFSTHCDALLENDTKDPEGCLLRRDQVWFVNKNYRSRSSIYPLSAYRLQKSESVRKAYRRGDFDALPFIDSLNLG